MQTKSRTETQADKTGAKDRVLSFELIVLAVYVAEVEKCMS